MRHATCAMYAMRHAPCAMRHAPPCAVRRHVERGFDSAATPRHTHDELGGEFQRDIDTLTARAGVYDAQDA